MHAYMHELYDTPAPTTPELAKRSDIDSQRKQWVAKIKPQVKSIAERSDFHCTNRKTSLSIRRHRAVGKCVDYVSDLCASLDRIP